MWSRWDMQDHPPDITITNYSMLNIMLMRSIEAPIFDQTRQWLQQDGERVFHLVVDELHSYRGTPGTEVAYLIRVLLGSGWRQTPRSSGSSPQAPRFLTTIRVCSISNSSLAETGTALQSWAAARSRSTWALWRSSQPTPPRSASSGRTSARKAPPPRPRQTRLALRSDSPPRPAIRRWPWMPRSRKLAPLKACGAHVRWALLVRRVSSPERRAKLRMQYSRP